MIISDSFGSYHPLKTSNFILIIIEMGVPFNVLKANSYQTMENVR